MPQLPAPTDKPSPITGCSADKFTAECIAGVAWVAGFGRDRPTLERAVAVALAESSGRTKIINSIGCCVGLWQINVKAHKQYTVAQMQDPQQNANAAWTISNGGRNWTPWEAFTKGAYLVYMPAAKIGVDKFYNRNPSNNPNNNPLVPDQLEQPLDQLSNLAQFPAKVTAWLSDRNNIIRLVKVGAGIAIAIVGVAVIARPIFKPVQETAMKVIGVAGPGKITKAATAAKGVQGVQQ
jgi:hypothetical protein